MRNMFIQEEDQELWLEVDGDRLNIDWLYYEPDSEGVKLEGGGSSFSIPIARLKELLERTDNL